MRNTQCAWRRIALRPTAPAPRSQRCRQAAPPRRHPTAARTTRNRPALYDRICGKWKTEISKLFLFEMTACLQSLIAISLRKLGNCNNVISNRSSMKLIAKESSRLRNFASLKECLEARVVCWTLMPMRPFTRETQWLLQRGFKSQCGHCDGKPSVGLLRYVN